MSSERHAYNDGYDKGYAAGLARGKAIESEAVAMQAALRRVPEWRAVSERPILPIAWVCNLCGNTQRQGHASGCLRETHPEIWEADDAG